jgi:RND family efflux transporter MFP subunit
MLVAGLSAGVLVAPACSKLNSLKATVGHRLGLSDSKASSTSLEKDAVSSKDLIYSYFPAKKITISDSIVFDGKLEAAEKVELRADKRMRLGPAKFKVGEQVKRGSVLFVVDTKELEQKRVESKERVDQLNVDIKSSRAQFAFAAKQLERKTGLVKKGIAAQKELEEAEKAFVAAEADLKTKELELRKAERELTTAAESVTAANIVSPIDGIIASTSNGGDDVNQGQQLALVANPRELAVSFQVDEIRVTKFKIGQSVDIAIDAVQGKSFKGLIKSIDASSQRGGAMSQYNVSVSLPAETVKSNGLRVGYSAKISAVFSAKENAIVVPRAALKQEGSQYFVLVADGRGKTPTAKAVKIGVQTDLEAEVSEGLKVGDFVVVSQKSTGGS